MKDRTDTWFIILFGVISILLGSITETKNVDKIAKQYMKEGYSYSEAYERAEEEYGEYKSEKLYNDAY